MRSADPPINLRSGAHVTTSRFARLPQQMRRLTGRPDPDDPTFRGVMRGRPPIVEIALLLPVLTAVGWFFNATGLGNNSLAWAPFFAGIGTIFGWPWLRPPIPVPGMLPRRVVGA